MDKRLKTLVWIISIILILFVVNWSYGNIFYPAYISYLADCDIKTNEEIENETGYITQGQTTSEVSEEGEKTTEVIILYEDLSDSIYKHEWIHVRQMESNRILSCEIPMTIYLAEVEAYTGQHLPDYIYKPIYGDYEVLRD